MQMWNNEPEKIKEGLESLSKLQIVDHVLAFQKYADTAM